MARSPHARFLLLTALTVGALWGGFAYAVLWNETSIVVTPSFFDSPVGLLALFPVRVVLWGIRVVETKVVHHPFRFPDNTRWIGVLSALVGAAIVGLPAFAALRVRGRARAAGGDDP
jgi:hypothetical protein